MKLLLGIVLLSGLLFGSVDLNTASAKELSTLKGVGMSKAQTIIAYREKHCFESIAELAKVKGIGEKTVEKNKANLSVSKCN